MKIAIDASCLARPDRTGVGVYAFNLIENLARIDRENEYTLCYRMSRLRRWKHFVRIRQPNFRTRIIQEPLNFLLRRSVDLFHGPDARLPEFKRARRVVTVHDLFSLVSDEFSDPDFIRKKKGRYAELAQSADRIISVSESTRNDIVERLGVPESRITVVPLGKDEIYKPVDKAEARQVAQRLGIDRPYVFFVGNLSARKNLVRMLEAFAALRPAIGRDLLFVMSGNVTYGGGEVMAAIDRLGVGDRVRAVGFVPRDDLPALYSGAEAFLFATLYEGFGIPILEAMACGTPVIASNVSAHPEVAGDAALLVDPRESGAIGDALEKILENSELRNGLVEKGLAQSARFSWEEMARRTLCVYKSVGGSPK